MSLKSRKGNNNYRARIRQLNYNLHEHDILFAISFFKFKCAYCNKGLDCDWELDHIVPISETDENEINFGSTSYNIVPTCQDCNRDKGNKDMETWVKSKFDNPEIILFTISQYQLVCGIEEILY